MAGLSSLRSYKVIKQIVLPDSTILYYDYGYGIDSFGSRVRDRLEGVARKSQSGLILWSRSYVYENSSLSYALTGKFDQLGRRLSTYSYDQAGFVTSTGLSNGVNRYDITNLVEAGTSRSFKQVVNPLGYREDYTFFYRKDPYDSADQPKLLEKIQGYATANIAAFAKSFSYDGNYGDYNVTGITNERGTRNEFQNDGELRPYNVLEAVGSASARSTAISWHPTFDLPTRIVKPGLTVDMIYSASGRLNSRIETDTTTTTVPYATSGQSRTWTYDWFDNGRIKSIDGPKGPDANGFDDVVSYTYDANGNLQDATNERGRITRYRNHDANGRPGYMRDENGVSHRYVYDELGRIKTVTVEDPASTTNNAVTTFDYDVESRVVGMTLPATEKMAIDYDLAGRVIAVRAVDGEKITLTYDAMGNVTAARTKYSSGMNARSITSTFDELGRMLTQTLGGNRQKSWTYDERGNEISATRARSNATVNAFDALDRLVYTVASDSGTEVSTLDAHDRPTAFTDANTVTTSMVRNGFGEVIGETSPDRGTRVFYYDAAGDLIATVDGRNQRVDYLRDALGRLTKKTPVGRPGVEVVIYNYDTEFLTGSYGVGRLSRVQHAAGATLFKYDHRGNMLTKRQAIGTTAAADLSYTYDLGDRITSITYPSGMVVAYDRDPRGRVQAVRSRPSASGSDTVLASNLVYQPFGSLRSASFGNGLSLVQDWGPWARLGSKRLYRTATGDNVSLLTYSYDGDDNITAITDGIDATRTFTFGYDAVDRLTRSTASLGTVRRQDFVHDLNGNRLRAESRAGPNDVAPMSTATYSLTTGTNRIASIAEATGTRTITYDANGNTNAEMRTGGVSVSAGYDGHARLISYTSGATALTHGYNGLDDRVSTTQGSDVQRFVYDPAGRLLGEYGTSASDVKAETIWLTPDPGTELQFGGDDGVGGYAPLAIATGGAIVWAHGNHLGVPVVLTDASGTAVSPGGYTKVGFPGQTQTLADLYYNRYRDYDPTTGRYIQSDPIGLAGGSNPYLYAEANPLKYIDPTGELAFVPIVIGALIGFDLSFGHQIWFQNRTLDCIDWTEVAGSTVLGAFGGQSFHWFRYGREWTIGTKGLRIAPFGNRNPNWTKPPHKTGRLPHYHRPGPKRPDGSRAPGHSDGRHRPWDKSPKDKSIWDRFWPW